MRTAPTSLRLFFAVWPDDAARRALADLAREVVTQRGGRPTLPANLHVTIAFLGSVPVNEVEALGEAGAASASDVDAFLLALDRVGGAGPQIAWIAPSSVPAALAALHERLVARLSPRVRVDARRFRPHVTLARRCTRPPRRLAVRPIAWTVERLALVASTPDPGGSRYDELAAWPLRRQSTSTV